MIMIISCAVSDTKLTGFGFAKYPLAALKLSPLMKNPAHIAIFN